MTDRGTVDSTRQRGEDIAPQLRAEVERLRDDFVQASDQADELQVEIERLRAEALRNEVIATGFKLELDELRAAIPEIVGCAYGEGLACRRDTDGRHGCCLARLRALRLGIGVAPEGWAQAGEDFAARYPVTLAKLAEEDDGA